MQRIDKTKTQQFMLALWTLAAPLTRLLWAVRRGLSSKRRDLALKRDQAAVLSLSVLATSVAVMAIYLWCGFKIFGVRAVSRIDGTTSYYPPIFPQARRLMAPPCSAGSPTSLSSGVESLTMPRFPFSPAIAASRASWSSVLSMYLMWKALVFLFGCHFDFAKISIFCRVQR